MRNILIPVLIVWLSLSGGCSIYRPTIQQGNILDLEQIDKLKPGMSRRQVIYVMGTPLLEDPFHKNRWDYIHTIKPGEGGPTTIQRVTLYFDKDSLQRIDKSALQKKPLN
ncbi:MAG: outer membrane protein assembly factor BamE [Gammaproteobacteria bacterium]|nr:outer membrane protein assembly factor BamE [Gammaproteobacteria bacterium]